MATVKANTTLVIQPKSGATYDLTFGGITQYGRTSGDTIGVFPVDKEYTLVKHGEVEVYALDAGGLKYYSVSELPATETLAPGATVVLTGTFAADVTSVSLTVDYVKGVKSWTGTVISANDPVDADGLPNGVTWIKV